MVVQGRVTETRSGILFLSLSLSPIICIIKLSQRIRRWRSCAWNISTALAAYIYGAGSLGLDRTRAAPRELGFLGMEVAKYCLCFWFVFTSFFYNFTKGRGAKNCVLRNKKSTASRSLVRFVAISEILLGVLPSGTGEDDISQFPTMLCVITIGQIAFSPMSDITRRGNVFYACLAKARHATGKQLPPRSLFRY